MARQLKVGKWWNNYNEKQQSAFIKLWKQNTHTINDIRKFITAASKKFDNVEFLKVGLISVNDTKHAYSFNSNKFYAI